MAKARGGVRRERLAEALRANLKRRKAGKRAAGKSDASGESRKEPGSGAPTKDRG